jgi:hypothetical protein
MTRNFEEWISNVEQAHKDLEGARAILAHYKKSTAEQTKRNQLSDKRIKQLFSAMRKRNRRRTS